MFRMPGESFRGDPPKLTEKQLSLRGRLRDHVETLAGTIGERNLGRYPDRLDRAADYIEEQFRMIGYKPHRQTFKVKGHKVSNIYVQKGSADDDRSRIVVGAHYDSIEGSPGANDNATGVAAVLELARSFRGSALKRPVDFVAFVNEEPPYFTTEQMGSARYARRLNRREAPVKTMISLETIGYYSDQPGSQRYPFPMNYFYPDRGNFIGFVGSIWYRQAVKEGIEAFRANALVPSQGIAAPQFVPGVSWSDHRSFWQYGYPAFMITDTALYRYPHYHQPTDTPSRVDYEKLTRVVTGMGSVVQNLQGE